MGSLTKAEMMQFGAGGGASSAIFQFTTTYLLFFFTNIAGIEASQAAQLILVMKVVDAIFDITAAYIVDNVDLKFGQGKYRPYIAAFAPILGLSIYIIFSSHNFGDDISTFFIYLAVAVFSIALSFCNMAYNGLTVKMSSNYDERASMITCKQLIGVGVGFFASFLPLYIAAYFGGGHKGWEVTALMMSVLVVSLFYISWYGSRKKDYSVNKSKQYNKQLSISSYQTILMQNKPLVALMICQSCLMFSVTLEGATAIYFFIYYLKGESLFPLYQGLVVALSSVAIFVAPKLIRHYDKRFVYISSCKLAIILLFIALYSSLNFSANVSLVFLVLLKVLIVFCANLVWMLLPDCVDYGEKKYGISAAAVTQSLLTFFAKIFSGLGVFFAGFVLSNVGFEAESATMSSEINLVFVTFKFLPFLLSLLISILVMRNYSITRSSLY
ncbi:MFS transporter [Vibrio splendidus]|uniref:Sugar transporter n=1 Tax=Vibrio splendidus 12E03 TaxID=1191305 RepID=A0A1E5FSQ3_VIBSP|nr:MFS transporter [Vibrio splendidus]OEF93550.1 hypothetical protein A142_20530 [Vibrio splendidus 12E03]